MKVTDTKDIAQQKQNNAEYVLSTLSVVNTGEQHVECSVMSPWGGEERPSAAFSLLILLGPYLHVYLSFK